MKTVEVRSAGEKGKGVFALKDFKKNELILRKKQGRIVKKEELPKLSGDDGDHTTEVKPGYYEVMPSPERYINHSCNPNAYCKKRIYYALKNIKKGEEITTDYRIGTRDKWVLDCKCGSKNCSKKG